MQARTESNESVVTHPIYHQMNNVQPLGVDDWTGPLMMSSPDGTPNHPEPSDAGPGSEIISHLSQDKVAYYGRNLSREQGAILSLVAEGRNIFFTGSAGMSLN